MQFQQYFPRQSIITGADRATVTTGRPAANTAHPATSPHLRYSQLILCFFLGGRFLLLIYSHLLLELSVRCRHVNSLYIYHLLSLHLVYIWTTSNNLSKLSFMQNESCSRI